MRFRFMLLAAVIPLSSACGGDGATAANDAAVADAPVTIDSTAADVPAADVIEVDTHMADAATADAPASEDAGVRVPVLNNCLATAYVDRSGEMDERTVVPRGTTGYTPRCLIVRAGQTVTFSMDFSVHPLVAGVPHGSSVGATTPSPIEAQRTGTTYAVPFMSAGFFPFYCTAHGHIGMAGVVRVVP